MNNLFLRLIGINSDFKKVFFVNEYKTLIGVKSRTIVTLLVILFLTFLALGFAVGSLQNLQKKMDDPFTNWVNVDVGSDETANLADKIIQRYNDPAVKDTFLFQHSGGFTRFNVFFFERNYLPYLHKTDTLLRSFWGRTIDVESSLFKTIISKESGNQIWLAPKLEKDTLELNQCEIVITEKMMELLGFKNADKIGSIGIEHERRIGGEAQFNKKMYLPIKIVGVVKKLPDVDFVCIPRLYNALNDRRINNKRCGWEIIKENEKGSTQVSLISENGQDISNIEKMAMQFFGQEDISIDLRHSVVSDSQEWVYMNMSFMPLDVPSTDSIQRFIEFSKDKIPVEEISKIDCDIQTCTDLDYKNYHYLAFHFDRLYHIEPFQQDLLEKFNVEIDMTQVVSKNNFALVTRLTYAISLILLGFAVLSVLLFVNSLLRTHLYKVSSNLGTFQAFGLNNKFLVGIYLKIILSFLGVSILIAYLLAVIVDLVEGSMFGLESRFDVFNLWVIGAILILIISSWILSYKSIKNILGDTPGNLIYGR